MHLHIKETLRLVFKKLYRIQQALQTTRVRLASLALCMSVPWRVSAVGDASESESVSGSVQMQAHMQVQVRAHVQVLESVFEFFAGTSSFSEKQVLAFRLFLTHK